MFVYEGRHRAIGAAKGDTVPEELGGVPGRVGWLDYEYSPSPAPSGGVAVKELSIDYCSPDTGAAEAQSIWEARHGK